VKAVLPIASVQQALRIELTEPPVRAAPHMLNLVVYFEGIALEDEVWSICWGS
jgi:hypothetical protein